LFYFDIAVYLTGIRGLALMISEIHRMDEERVLTVGDFTF